MDERPDDRDTGAAERLDRAVDDVLDGRLVGSLDPDTGSALRYLIAAHRPPVPPAVRARLARAVARERTRTEQPVRVAALALGLLILSHAVGNLAFGRWVAGEIHGEYDAHAYLEGGFALLALAAVLLGASARPRWLDLATVVGVPAAIAFGVHGIPEIGVSAAGAALHLAEGTAGVALGVVWWRSRRYARRAGAEEGV